MDKKTNRLAYSAELTGFYQALAKLQSNAIFHVLQGADTAETKKRAHEVTLALEAWVDELQEEPEAGQSCPRGQRWDEVLKVCVDIRPGSQEDPPMAPPINDTL